MNEIDGAENMGINKSPAADAEMNEIGEFDQPTNRLVALFSPQPYILQENRLVTIENSILANSHVGFALATSITPSEDQKNLRPLKLWTWSFWASSALLL